MLDSLPVARIPSRTGHCRGCGHTRAAHSRHGARCYSTRCACTGWLTPGTETRTA